MIITICKYTPLRLILCESNLTAPAICFPMEVAALQAAGTVRSHGRDGEQANKRDSVQKALKAHVPPLYGQALSHLLQEHFTAISPSLSRGGRCRYLAP